MDIFEASEPSQPSRKRRKLLYQELETFECQANSVREAARTWALSKNEKVGSFRSPRLIPTMQWGTTANCHEHTGCFAACGRVFRFRRGKGWTTSTSWRSHLRRIIPVRCVQSQPAADRAPLRHRFPWKTAMLFLLLQTTWSSRVSSPRRPQWRFVSRRT